MHTKRTRILAIDPGTRELGVAILESEGLLFYGVKTVQKRTTPEEVLQGITRIIKQLIDHYAPSILAIEKVISKQKNASLLIVATEQIKSAAREELFVYEYEPKVIRRFICQAGKATKREVANHLARKYYELNQYLNRKSKWEQLYYAKMFDAIAVGLICYAELADGQKNDNRSYKNSYINIR